MTVRWIVLFYFMMFVSAFGIEVVPGNLPLASISVIVFLGAVFGLVASSVVRSLRSSPVSQQPRAEAGYAAPHARFYPSDFQEVNVAFWSRLEAASARMATLGAAGGLTSAGGASHGEGFTDTAVQS